MGHPRPLFRLFSVFFKQTSIQFYNKLMWKCSSSIWHWESNPRPSERESPPITPWPGLLYLYIFHTSVGGPDLQRDEDKKASASFDQLQLGLGPLLGHDDHAGPLRRNRGKFRFTKTCFLNGPSAASFSSFQTNITILTSNICEKIYDHPIYGARIWTHDLQNASVLP